MNKKVLNVMIWLTWGILAFFLVVKLFFGEWVAIVVTNDKLVKIGVFIDNHFWAYQAVAFLFTLLTYWIYLCACSKQWYLRWKQTTWIFPILVVLQLIKIYYPQIGSQLDLVAMILLPYLLKSDFKSTAFVFTAHSISQIVCLFARNMPSLPIVYNSMSMIILMIDQYIWLLLYYFYQNKYKKE